MCRGLVTQFATCGHGDAIMIEACRDPTGNCIFTYDIGGRATGKCPKCLTEEKRTAKNGDEMTKHAYENKESCEAMARKGDSMAMESMNEHLKNISLKLGALIKVSEEVLAQLKENNRLIWGAIVHE